MSEAESTEIITPRILHWVVIRPGEEWLFSEEEPEVPLKYRVILNSVPHPMPGEKLAAALKLAGIVFAYKYEWGWGWAYADQGHKEHFATALYDLGRIDKWFWLYPTTRQQLYTGRLRHG